MRTRSFVYVVRMYVCAYVITRLCHCVSVCLWTSCACGMCVPVDALMCPCTCGPMPCVTLQYPCAHLLRTYGPTWGDLNRHVARRRRVQRLQWQPVKVVESAWRRGNPHGRAVRRAVLCALIALPPG